MESDDFTRHYIIRYLSARELVLPPLGCGGGGVEMCEDRYLDGVDVSFSDNKLLDAEEFREPRPLVDRSQCHCLIRVQTLTKF